MERRRGEQMDGMTDRHSEDNSRFSQFCERAAEQAAGIIFHCMLFAVYARCKQDGSHCFVCRQGCQTNEYFVLKCIFYFCLL